MKNVKQQGLDAPLILGAKDVLRRYGLHADVDRTMPKIGKREIDAVFRIQLPGGRERLYFAEVRPALHTATVATVIQHKARNDETLLITQHVPPPMAELLRNHRIAFVDLAGNAWLQTPEFLIWVNGQKPARPVRTQPAPRAFQLGGLQLIFALLTNPDWVALTTRELAAKVGIANGTVAAALRDLTAQGFVVGGTRRRFPRRLRNRETLLNKWTEGYLQRVQATTLLNRYRTDLPDGKWWRDKERTRFHALLGGEAAAAVLTEFLTPQEITFYLDGPPGPLIADGRLRQDTAGNVILRRKFWKFEATEWTHPEAAPPVLVYADLMGTGDARCIETAGRIRDQYLARLLEN